MLTKPDGCRECPLWQTGRGFVPDEVIESAAVFVLMQNPGADEVEVGRPAVGKAGQYQESVLFQAAGLERGINVSIGNALRCRWKHSNNLPPEPVLSEALRWCQQYLQIPKSVRLIVAEGALAWRALGGPGTITAWRGQLRPPTSGESA